MSEIEIATDIPPPLPPGSWVDWAAVPVGGSFLVPQKPGPDGPVNDGPIGPHLMQAEATVPGSKWTSGPCPSNEGRIRIWRVQ